MTFSHSGLRLTPLGEKVAARLQNAANLDAVINELEREIDAEDRVSATEKK